MYGKRGEKSPNYGKHLPLEVRLKISKSHTGKSSPMKGKKNPKISEKMKGRKISDEQKRK